MRWVMACLLAVLVLAGYAQDETDGADPQAEEGEVLEGEAEGTGEESGSEGGLLKVPITIKNGSSFERTLSAYDEVCRRYLFFSRRFKGWQSERVKMCTDITGHGDVTVLRSLGGRKKRFTEIEVNAILKF